MHPRFVELLCCPATGERLQLQATETSVAGMVATGKLVSSSGREYPVIRGIPRFVSAESYAGSFGYEWNRWPRVQFEDENVGRPMQGHTKRMWETITGATDEQVRGKTIVEFGCGPGRFLDVVRSKGGVAIGVELSQAVEAARRNFADDPDVLIVQADILQPPLRKDSLDGGYSIGVLHHTPDPQLGLQKLASLVRPDGWLSVCVYPEGEFYDYRSVARMRRWMNGLRGKWGYKPALWYSLAASYGLVPACRWLRKVPGLRQLIRYGERNWFVMLDLPDARWRVLDVFDAITPAIATTHSAKEVEEWLAAADCCDAMPTPWCKTSFTARRASTERQRHAA